MFTFIFNTILYSITYIAGGWEPNEKGWFPVCPEDAWEKFRKPEDWKPNPIGCDVILPGCKYGELVGICNEPNTGPKLLGMDPELLPGILVCVVGGNGNADTVWLYLFLVIGPWIGCEPVITDCCKLPCDGELLGNETSPFIGKLCGGGPSPAAAAEEPNFDFFKEEFLLITVLRFNPFWVEGTAFPEFVFRGYEVAVKVCRIFLVLPVSMRVWVLFFRSIWYGTPNFPVRSTVEIFLFQHSSRWVEISMSKSFHLPGISASHCHVTPWATGLDAG